MRQTRELVGLIEPIRWAGQPVPERQWIVQDVIPRRNVTMLNGDGGLGKTLILQQLLTSCATGTAWLNMDATRCKTLGLFCEDDEDELHRRQADINRAYGVDFEDLEHMTMISRVSVDNALVEFDPVTGKPEPTGLAVDIRNMAIDRGVQLIVLDSLHDLFAGNENNRLHARAFISELRSIALEIDGAIVIAAHPSLSGMASGSGSAGSTAWNNSVRSRLYLKRPADDGDGEPDPDARLLTTMKANYGRFGEEWKLRWQDGVLVSEEPAGGVVAAIERHQVQRAFLACLDAATRQGRAVTESPRSPSFAPKVFARMPQAERAGARELGRAMEALFAAGEIVVGPVGTYANRTAKLGIRRALSAQTNPLTH